MRILVADDEPLLASTIAEWLRQRAPAVYIGGAGASARKRVDVNDYDLLILDRDISRIGVLVVMERSYTIGQLVLFWWVGSVHAS